MSVRAVVRRPRRKAHLAHRSGDLRTWTTYCDLIVVNDADTAVHEFDSIGGATARLSTQLRGIIAHIGRPHLCAHCRSYVMLIELLQYDRAHGPAHEYRLTA